MEQCKNCVFLLDINCHPSNGEKKLYEWLADPHKIGKGSIITPFGFGCSLQFENSMKESAPIITFLDDDSGLCEMFTPKDKFKLVLKIEEL